MPEHVPPPSRRSRYVPDSLRVSRALYYLTAFFLASRPLSDLCGGDVGCSFSPLRDECEESEITHLLIELAVTLRIADDMLDDDLREPIEVERTRFSVGTLSMISKGEPVAMDIRTACNKIIHAERIHFDRGLSTVTGSHYLNPIVYLYGSQGNQEWKADLDVL